MNRQQIAALSLVAVLATSGCIGFLTGDKALAFESTPATVSESTIQESGYEKKRVKKIPMNKTFTYRDKERTVNVTNWAVHYSKSANVGGMGDQEAAQFITFTSPQVDILGESFNPLGKMSQTELANTIVGQSSSVNNLQKVGETNIVMLDEGTTVTTFEATIQPEGTNMDVDVYVHMTRVKHEGDFVVAVGVYPQQIDEKENILALMRNLNHNTDS